MNSETEDTHHCPGAPAAGTRPIGQSIGIPIGPNLPPAISMPGMDWKLSDETRAAIEEIERHARWSMHAARSIYLD